MASATSLDSLTGNIPTLAHRTADPSHTTALVLLVMAGILPFLNSLYNSFHFDDVWDITLNRHLDTFWGFVEVRPVNRFLTFLTLWMNNQLHGRDFLPGWHAINIALHVLCILTLYGVLCLLHSQRKFRTWAPLAGAMLFACHPLVTEPVNYIRARSCILYAMFSLGALGAAVLFHRSRTWKARMGALTLLAFCVGFASLSKEVGLLFGLLMPLVYGVMVLRWGVVLRQWRVLALAGIVLLLMVAAGWWFLTVTDRLRMFRELSGNQLLTQHMLAEVTVFWKYVGLCVFPHPGQLSVDHHVVYWPLRTYRVWDGDVAASLMGILGIAVGAVWVRRRRPELGLLLLLLPLGILPYYFIVTVDMMVEYKFYLPLAAFCSLAGWMVAEATRGRRVWAAGVLGCMVLVLGLWSWERNRAWRTEVTLWSDAVAKAPRRARSVNSLAWALLHDPAGDAALGLRLAQQSLDGRSTDPWPGPDPYMFDTLAEAHYRNGHVEIALEIADRIRPLIEGNVEYFDSQREKYRAAAKGTQ